MGGEVQAVAALLGGARQALALTGAGVSTASGIPDFRSQSGIWQHFDPMEVATIEAWRRDPDVVWDFYRARLSLLAEARPNAAHHALAALARAGLLAAVVTQNVDGLHEAAGTPDVVAVHGSLAAARCLACGAELARADVEHALEVHAGAPRCACGAPLKPGVVLFGELLPEAAIERALALAGESDLLLCCGTSLEVFPVAALPGEVLGAGGRLAILTEGDTPWDGDAHVRSRAPLHELLPAVCAELGLTLEGDASPGRGA